MGLGYSSFNDSPKSSIRKFRQLNMKSANPQQSRKARHPMENLRFKENAEIPSHRIASNATLATTGNLGTDQGTITVGITSELGPRVLNDDASGQIRCHRQPMGRQHQFLATETTNQHNQVTMNSGTSSRGNVGFNFGIASGASSGGCSDALPSAFTTCIMNKDAA